MTEDFFTEEPTESTGTSTRGQVLFPANVGSHPSLRRWTWDNDPAGTPLTAHEEFWRRWETDGWQPELWELEEL